MKAVVFSVSSELLASVLHLPVGTTVLNATADDGTVDLTVTHPGLPDFGDEPRRCRPDTRFQWGFQ